MVPCGGDDGGLRFSSCRASNIFVKTSCGHQNCAVQISYSINSSDIVEVVFHQ